MRGHVPEPSMWLGPPSKPAHLRIDVWNGSNSAFEHCPVKDCSLRLRTFNLGPDHEETTFGSGHTELMPKAKTDGIVFDSRGSHPISCFT